MPGLSLPFQHTEALPEIREGLGHTVFALYRHPRNAQAGQRHAHGDAVVPVGLNTAAVQAQATSALNAHGVLPLLYSHTQAAQFVINE